MGDSSRKSCDFTALEDVAISVKQVRPKEDPPRKLSLQNLKYSQFWSRTNPRLQSQKITIQKKKNHLPKNLIPKSIRKCFLSSRPILITQPPWFFAVVGFSLRLWPTVCGDLKNFRAWEGKKRSYFLFFLASAGLGPSFGSDTEMTHLSVLFQITSPKTEFRTQ